MNQSDKRALLYIKPFDRLLAAMVFIKYEAVICDIFLIIVLIMH